MKKLMLVCLFLLTLGVNTFGGDIDKVETTLYKVNDFKYEQVITISFKNIALLERNDALFDVKSYQIYAQDSFDEDNPDLAIYPIKVKPLVVRAGVKLWVKLNRDKGYVLVVKDNTLKYTNGEFVKGFLVSGIILKDKYHKYLAQKPLFDFKSNLLSADASGLDVACDFTGSYSWELLNWLLSITVDGKVATEKATYFDALAFLGGFKKNLWKEGYLPVSISEKVETTQNFDKVDLMTVVGTEFVVPISGTIWDLLTLVISKTQFCPFPVVTLGYEAGWHLNTGMFLNRATLGFDWKVPFGKSYMLTWDFKPYYRPSDIPSYTSFFSIGLDKKVNKDTNFIVGKYSRGSLPPSFVEHEKFVTGIAISLQ